MRSTTLLATLALTLLLLSCSKESPVQPLQQPILKQTSGPKAVPLRLPVTWGIWGPHDSHLTYTLNEGFTRQVAHIGYPVDESLNSENLVNWIQAATAAGYHFFMYQFPRYWIQMINDAYWRQIIINRINTVKALYPGINTYNAYVDDVDNGSYTAGQLDVLKSLLPSGQLLYASASTNNPIVSHADAIICDDYADELSAKRTVYTQLRSYGKPFQVWVSIEPRYAPNPGAIEGELRLAWEFTDCIWIFADMDGNTCRIDDGQFAKFLSARSAVWGY